MAVKDYAAWGSVVISATAAVFAYDASKRADELANREFLTEKTLEMLTYAHKEVLEAERNEARSKWSCILLAALQTAEAQARSEEPFIIKIFAQRVAKENVWPATCLDPLEKALADMEPSATSFSTELKQDVVEQIENAPRRTPRKSQGLGLGGVDNESFMKPGSWTFDVGSLAGIDTSVHKTTKTVADSPSKIEWTIGNGGSLAAADATQADTSITAAKAIQPSDLPSSIGQWHALVATYPPSECNEYASAVVDGFAKRLGGLGFDDRHIYVVRRPAINSYSVTVDAGNDKGLAEKISRAIRAAAPADGTGRDSFVRGNRGWTIDPACVAFAKVER